MRMTRRPAAAVAPSHPEEPHPLTAARLAIAEARRRELDIALEIQSAQVEGTLAANARDRVASRVAGRGGAVEQADVAADAEAAAVMACVEPRVALQQEALRRAEADTRELESRLDALLRKEVDVAALRVGLLAKVAKQRWDAAEQEHWRLVALERDAGQLLRASSGVRARIGDLGGFLSQLDAAAPPG